MKCNLGEPLDLKYNLRFDLTYALGHSLCGRLRTLLYASLCENLWDSLREGLYNRGLRR